MEQLVQGRHVFPIQESVQSHVRAPAGSKVIPVDSAERTDQRVAALSAYGPVLIAASIVKTRLEMVF
jgi:hypothetical protein